jgi:thiamine biosynthesis lipoprotein
VIVAPEAVMGTVVSMSFDAPGAGAGDMWLAVAEARSVLHRADAVFSLWKPESPLNQIRQHRLSLEDAPPEVGEVLLLCALVREQSGGWFDPWALPGGVDPTGLVKGWAAARALSALTAAGARSAMVSAGGDLAAYGPNPAGGPWRVGITHPWSRRNLVAVVEVDGTGAVCTSGTYERGLHLVDPGTAQASRRTVSATVTGPDLAVADGLATGLAAGGDEALAAVEALDGYEGWLIRPDGSGAATTGFAFAAPTPQAA